MVRMETTLQMFMESTNRRFTEQREDINQRFTEQRKDINQRFEQGDADSANDRHCLHRVLPCDAVGYAWWDRRTIVRKAKLEALAKTEESRKNALVEQVVAEVIRRLESRKAALSQSAPLPATS